MDSASPSLSQPAKGFNFAQIPLARQVLLLVGIAISVALGVGLILWARTPGYTHLFVGLDAKDAGQIVQFLQKNHASFALGNDGSSISVPATDVAQLKLKLAAQGLPQGTGEKNNVTPSMEVPLFGMSELAEKMRYQQQQESDLANTLSNLQPIKSARVHLALPRTSAFVRDHRPASASVVITLYPGRQLDTAQVAAIVHLVASSVPGLDPKYVSVVDQKGQLLASDDSTNDTVKEDTRFLLTQRIENAYSSRIEELLASLVGKGRVHAQVVVQLDSTEVEKASELFHPESEQGINSAISSIRSSNQKTAGNTGIIYSDSVRNSEVERTVSHTRQSIGAVRRLSIAVVLDNKDGVDTVGKPMSIPLTQPELDQITQLVKNTVGFDAQRGDSISIINIPFHKEPLAIPIDVPLWEQPRVLEFVKQGISGLLVLALMFGILRPLLRNLLEQQKQQSRRKEVLVLADESSTSIESDPVPDRLSLSGNFPSNEPVKMNYEQHMSLAKRMAIKDPQQIAHIIKSWVIENVS